MKLGLLKVISSWIQSHIIATVVISVVVVGAVATPIILLNQDNDPKEEIKEEVKKDNDEQEVICDEGFVLNENNICEEVKEDDAEQKPTDNSKPNQGTGEDKKPTSNNGITGFLDCPSIWGTEVRYNKKAFIWIVEDPIYIIKFDKAKIDSLTKEEKSWVLNTCLNNMEYFKYGGSSDSSFSTLASRLQPNIKMYTDLITEYSNCIKCEDGMDCTAPVYYCQGDEADVIADAKSKLAGYNKQIADAKRAQDARQELFSLFR